MTKLVLNTVVLRYSISYFVHLSNFVSELENPPAESAEEREIPGILYEIPFVVYGTVRFVCSRGRNVFVSYMKTVHQWNPQLVSFPTRCRTCSTDGIWPPVSPAVRGMSISG